MSETKTADKAREARIDKILQGAVDPHVHSGPSIAPRAIDHLDLVRQLSEAGFAAVVTKDHDYAGVATAQLITKHHPELRTTFTWQDLDEDMESPKPLSFWMKRIAA